MKKIGLITLIFLGIITFFASKFVYAKKVTDFSIESKELYDATNTYNYNTPYAANSARYNMNVKNNNKVDESSPLLTIFTHGLNGKASHWSNIKGEFAYTYDSLFSRLSRIADSNVYYAKLNDLNTLEIYNLTNEIDRGNKSKENFKFQKLQTISNITDIAKHSIIIFEANTKTSKSTNDKVYSEFNYAISKIVYDIKTVNNNKLPKMNLIGHSRGGITNMQYALDHPDLVDSIYSFGTPYAGSTSASIDFHVLGSEFSEPEAEQDIIKRSIYTKYMDRWNNNYNSLYSNIKVTALGGYSTLLNLSLGLGTEKSLEFLKDKTGMSKDALRILIPGAIGALNGIIVGTFLASPITSIKGKIISLLIPFVKKIFNTLNIESSVDDFVEILFNELNLDFHPPFASWYNDCLVDLGSQIGQEGLLSIIGKRYTGFNQVIKCFDGNNVDYDATSDSDMPAVVHNLEARDIELGNYVISSIKMGYATNNDYATSIVNDYDCSIDLYIGNTKKSTLEIPEYIGGKKVVAISDYAFSNDLYKKEKIEQIIIPKTVKEIGKNAFYNSKNISSITFASDSNLTTIKKDAFSKMPLLKHFTIPTNVNYIAENAFSKSNVASFSIINNSNYEWKNNLLIDKNVSDTTKHIAIYANPNASSITFPDNVSIILSSLFEGNRNIKNIDLNNVEFIGDRAFANSTLTTILKGNKVIEIGDLSFINTPWINRQNSNFITIGKVLIQHLGNDSDVVIPEGITKICSNCFTSNKIKSIVIPSTITSISKDVFTKLPKLQSIIFTSTQPPVLDGKISNSSVNYYVKNSSHNYYMNSQYFKEYKNQIKLKNIKITFTDTNNNIIGSTIQNYGNTLYGLRQAPNIKGMDFINWIDENDNIVKPYSYLNSYNDLSLKPVYEKSKYILNIFNGSSNTSRTIHYGDIIDLNIPHKSGYKFLGWYDREYSGNLIVDNTGRVIWNRTNKVEYLYVHYELIIYNIFYETNDAKFSQGYLRNTFTVEHPLTTNNIPELKKFGYVFEHWLYNNSEFISTSGIYKDIYLRPNFKGVVRNIYYTTTINDEYAIINLKYTNYNNELYFRISPNVKTATFLGYNKEFTNMKIKINNRSGALILGFENITFYPEKSKTGIGYDAISSYAKCDIYLNYKGRVKILGGEGKDGISHYNQYTQAQEYNCSEPGSNGGYGSSGGKAIATENLTISQFDNSSYIEVVGGKGGNGGRGGNGQAGASGLKSPRGSFLWPVKGDDGRDGGNGGHGGHGGSGGYAILTFDITHLLVSSSSNYKFIGGQGGLGGSGGYGGSGGIGASDISSNPFTGVGDPGNGGNGGRGGNGGNGGDGAIPTNALNVYGTGGSPGSGGYGSRGGYAGSGGSAGSHGNNGSDGKIGTNGDSGNSGEIGKNGKNLVGNSQSVKNTTYVYNKKFILKVYNGESSNIYI